MDREQNEETQPGPSGTSANAGNSYNNFESSDGSSTCSGESGEMANRRYTPFGTQLRIITTDGMGYFWKFEDDDDSEDELEIFPLPRPSTTRGPSHGTRAPSRRYNTPARETEDSSRPASIFDYPNQTSYEDDNNNTDEFPNLNGNIFNEEENVAENESHDELQNESSENNGDWPEVDERLAEIECRRCNRTYTSGTLFVRTECNHLICVTCMWEYAINSGINNCPVCGGFIDYTESIHIEDIEDGPLCFRKNNNN